MAGPPIPEPRQALAAILSHAARHSPYYREQDWARRLLADGRLRLGEIPLTLKRIVKAAPERFFSSFVPAADGQVIVKHTSGSTGEPAPVRKTLRHFEVNTLEYHRLRDGWGFADHRRVVRVLSHEENLKLGTLTEEPRSGGGRCWTLVSVDADAVFDLLRHSAATLVVTFPSIMSSVLERSLEAPEPLQLRLVSTISELVPDELRALVKRIPGCRLVDLYGSVETGLIAAQCPLCEAYHPADRHLRFELVGEDGRSVTPGEMGRIVITPLFNTAMPLVRYETGDYAIERIGNRCPRSNRAIERILGRERNLFTLSDGSKIVPGIPAVLLYELGARRFKLVQTAPGEVELRYIPREEHSEISREAAQAVVDKHLSPKLRAVPVRVTDLPRSASGKYLTHESLV